MDHGTTWRDITSTSNNGPWWGVWKASGDTMKITGVRSISTLPWFKVYVSTDGGATFSPRTVMNDTVSVDRSW